MPRLLFHDGNATIAYVPPVGWTFSGGETKLRLTPRDREDATAIIQSVPQPVPMTLDEDGVKALRQAALNLVPQGSQEVKILSEQKKPMLIGRHQTFEVCISYGLKEHACLLDALFLDLDKSQVQFVVNAPKFGFEPVSTAFRKSLFSWQWLR